MANRFEDAVNFNKLKETITEKLGVDCSQYSDSFLARRFETRLRATDTKNYGEYNKILESDGDEHPKLLKELFIHVTNFFRDYSMWVYFKDTIIPKVMEKKRLNKQKKIRIWSAGCSLGMEAISIAISFMEKLGENLSGYTLEILGTDYDLATVMKAREGMYEESAFVEMPPAYKERYFDLVDEANGIYKVKPRVVSNIKYSRGDILNDPIPDNLDIIFCRNTVIYFNLQSKSELYVKFFNALNEHGIFVMGKTEILQGKAREYFDIVDTKERIYDKKPKKERENSFFY